jgi:hypothetical protein
MHHFQPQADEYPVRVSPRVSVAKIKTMTALFSSGFTMKGMKDMKKGEVCHIVPAFRTAERLWATILRTPKHRAL